MKSWRTVTGAGLLVFFQLGKLYLKYKHGIDGSEIDDVLSPLLDLLSACGISFMGYGIHYRTVSNHKELMEKVQEKSGEGG